MDIPSNQQSIFRAQSDFWDSLSNEMLLSNQKLSYDDVMAYIEQNIMFTLFFRSCSPLETTCYESLLGLQRYGYMLMLEFCPEDKTKLADFNVEPLDLYHCIKKVLQGTNNSIGPYFKNRISILITDDKYQTEFNKEESISLTNSIRAALFNEFHITTSIGIGSIQNVKSIYKSYIDAKNCLQFVYPNQSLHIQDLVKEKLENQYDYVDAEKHMLVAVRMKKSEAYGYFSLLMDYIKNDSTDNMRNKLLEILVLTTHAMRLDSKDYTGDINYTYHLKDLMSLEGDELIEWAYQKFIGITRFVKPQNQIDYNNRIVQSTKEYLEAHYAEEITLEDLAEQVNISPQYFSKLLKKTTGFNFIDWLSMLRVKKAKELLTTTNLTVKEVCFLVGYKDPNYFSRIFKKRIGITPSEYVKKQ